MTAPTVPASRARHPPRPVVWFPDTSALVTLAVHEPLQRAVQAVMSRQRRVLVAAVVVELDGLADGCSPVSSWAKAALGQLAWLGTPVAVDDPTGTDLAARLQEEVAAGRPGRHPMEHFGEAAIIALASRATSVTPWLFSDDYDARVVAKSKGVHAASTHRLIHSMLRSGSITADQAAGYARALYEAGRALDYTAGELAAGRLGRVGQP